MSCTLGRLWNFEFSILTQSDPSTDPHPFILCLLYILGIDCYKLGSLFSDQRLARLYTEAQAAEAHEGGCREEHTSQGRGRSTTSGYQRHAFLFCFVTALVSNYPSNVESDKDHSLLLCWEPDSIMAGRQLCGLSWQESSGHTIEEFTKTI